MSDQNVSVGGMLHDFFAGILSLLTTGSWHLKNAADEARTAGLVLDQVPEAAQQDAERTLEIVNAGLTSYQVLKNRAAAAGRDVEKWQDHVTTILAKYKACADGDPQKVQYEALLKSAIESRMKAEKLRDSLNEAVEGARPQAEGALLGLEDREFG